MAKDLYGQFVVSLDQSVQSAYAPAVEDTMPRALLEPALTPEVIKAIRERFGYTLEEMSAHAGVSLFTWHRWEKGQRHPRHKQQRRLEALRQEAMQRRKR